MVNRLSLDMIPGTTSVPYLAKGVNNIQYKLSPTKVETDEIGKKDDFLLLDVVVHWSEAPAT